jgi:hypothetical protein
MLRRFRKWRMERRWKKEQAKLVKMVPTNRATRRRDARKIAGRDGDKKAIYRALKAREK